MSIRTTFSSAPGATHALQIFFTSAIRAWSLASSLAISRVISTATVPLLFQPFRVLSYGRIIQLWSLFGVLKTMRSLLTEVISAFSGSTALFSPITGKP